MVLPLWQATYRTLLVKKYDSTSICFQYVSGYDLPDWVMVNDTLDRLLALRDIYASSPPQEVAYLRGGMVRSGVG